MSNDNKNERPADHFDKDAWVQFGPTDALEPSEEYRIVTYHQHGNPAHVTYAKVYERRLAEPAVGSLVRAADGCRYVRAEKSDSWSWMNVDAPPGPEMVLETWQTIRGLGPVEILWDGR